AAAATASAATASTPASARPASTSSVRGTISARRPVRPALGRVDSLTIGVFTVEVWLAFFVFEVATAFKGDGFIAFRAWLSAVAGISNRALAGRRSFTFGARACGLHFG